MDLLAAVRSAIGRHGMLPEGGRVLVGLSGGADSACLTLALRDLGYSVHTLYVDHGLRPTETPSEREFCRGFCSSLGVPFAHASVDVAGRAREMRMNPQEAARELRYAALEDEARRLLIDRIALGHTLDDQAETLLLHLIRGAGMRGLGGIPPVRGIVVRPLIECERRHIEEFLSARNQGFVTDSSNLKQAYTRNRVRARILPALKEINPSVVSSLGRASEIFREEDRYLEVQAAKAAIRLFTGGRHDDSVELFRSPLLNLDRVLLRRVLRLAIGQTRGLRGLGLSHVEDVIALIQSGAPGDRIDLGRGVRAVMSYATFKITSAPALCLMEHALEGQGMLALAEAGLAISASVTETPPEGAASAERAVLDAEAAPFPLTVRARRPGDFFRPAGFGHRRKLQDFLVDLKVPREGRDAIPIVANAAGEVLWVAGHRADARFVAGERTRRFLVLELKRSR